MTRTDFLAIFNIGSLIASDGIAQNDSQCTLETTSDSTAEEQKKNLPRATRTRPLGHHFAPHLIACAPEWCVIESSQTSRCFSLALLPATVSAVVPDS
jgi:L-threonylcarbamoyladenylate synthase